MAQKVSKSRSFAVITLQGGGLKIVSMWRKVAEGQLPTLETQVTSPFPVEQRDLLIKLLVNSGITVRFFDPEEKQWVDQSLLYGVIVAPGSRDGTWGIPSLEEFESKYLLIV